LNLDLATAITRTTIATLAELAQPTSTPVTPAGLVARARTSASLFLRGGSCSSSGAAGAGVVGYHVYRSATSHGTYQRLTSSPIGQPSYMEFVDSRQDAFYVVTAVDQADDRAITRRGGSKGG